MEHKSLTRLEQIHEINRNNFQWKNKDLYRFFYKEDMYRSAYEKIKSNKGSLTKGSTNETLDGFTRQRIQNVIKAMQDKSFEFNPAQPISIPKGSDGKKVVGASNRTDEIVQELIRMILEAIYEPVFLETSHGFRPNRSCHSALLQVEEQFDVIKWVVKREIQGAYDRIDHSILLDLLRRKIQDESFIQLIQKALKAGYLDQLVSISSVIGTVQGSIVSPILANIYFHQLDVFVETLKDKYQTKVKDVKGRKRTDYNELRTIITQEEQTIKNYTDQSQPVKHCKLVKRLKRKPTTVQGYETDLIPILIRYVRYADEWIVGINGPKKIALECKNEIANFLVGQLRLKLSSEKIKLTYLKNEKALFLGYEIFINPNIKVAKFPTMKKVSYKRTTGKVVKLCAPIDGIIYRLSIKGFCDGKGFPISKQGWTVQSDEIIVQAYNRVLVGILDYYSGAENQRKLIRIQFILQHSCACTLAQRHQSTVSKIYAKHGSAMEVKLKGERKSSNNLPASVEEQVSIEQYEMVRLQLRKFNKTQIKWSVNQRFYDPCTSSKIAENCCIGGINVIKESD